MKQITQDYLQRILDQRRRRDHAAFMIGTAYVEFQQVSDRLRQDIEQSLKDESILAADAVRAIGIDPESVTYAITDSGQVEIKDGI